MATVGGFDRYKHLEELASPLDTGEGVLSPLTRRGKALTNLSGATMTAVQLAFLGGVTAGTGLASKALVLDANGDVVVPGDLQTSDQVGTITTTGTTTGIERGGGAVHTTDLTLTAFAVGTSGDATDLAIGASLYTFPAGDIVVENATMIGTPTAAISVTTDTPEMGLGNTLSSGANATLGASAATDENIAGPFVATSVDGTDVTDGGGNLVGSIIAAAASHVVYLNMADGWADVTAAGAVTWTGTVSIRWRIV